MFNSWTGWGELLIALSMCSFYLNLWVENTRPEFDALYGIWDEFSTNLSAGLGLLIVCSCVITIDTMGGVIKSAAWHLIWKTPFMQEESVALKWINFDKPPEVEQFTWKLERRKTLERRKSGRKHKIELAKSTGRLSKGRGD